MGKPRVVDAMQNAGYRLTDQPGVYRRDAPGLKRIVCNFGRVRELLKSPHSKEPDSGPRNIRKKSGAPRWKGHVEP